MCAKKNLYIIELNIWITGITVESFICNCWEKNLLTYSVTYLLTYSMQQSPSWEANRFSARKESPRILWNLKVQYWIHEWPPLVPILSQLDPVHTPTSNFLKIHLNIILLSVPGSPKWSLSLKFPHQNFVYASHLPIYTSHLRFTNI